MYSFIHLENKYVSANIDYMFGGKLVELRNKSSNYNSVWFDKEKYANFSPLKFSDYDSQWIGGYEELYPNDKVELLLGNQAPDHGELWSSNWEIINNTSTILEIQCFGYFSNSTITKKFELVDNKIFVNIDISQIKFDNYLFKLHLALPINKTKVEFDYESFKKVDNKFGNIVENNHLNDFLTPINANEGRNDFVYFYGLNSSIKIFEDNKNVCILEYDRETLPYFWIFQSRGGWNNLNVNVLEPCNSGLKDIQKALENDLIHIPDDKNFHTWYTIELI